MDCMLRMWKCSLSKCCSCNVTVVSDSELALMICDHAHAQGYNSLPLLLHISIRTHLYARSLSFIPDAMQLLLLAQAVFKSKLPRDRGHHDASIPANDIISSQSAMQIFEQHSVCVLMVTIHH